MRCKYIYNIEIDRFMETIKYVLSFMLFFILLIISYPSMAIGIEKNTYSQNKVLYIVNSQVKIFTVHQKGKVKLPRM